MTADATDPRSEGLALVSARHLRGTPVFTRDGEKLGTVEDVILEKRSGRVAYVIMTSGGFLAIGQAYHPIPWAAVQYDEKQEGYVAAIDRRLLDGAPSYRPDSAPVFDAAYGRRVTDYYGLPAFPTTLG